MIRLNRDTWVCVFLLSSGVGICLWSLPYGLGTLAYPGIGFMSFCAGAAVSFFSIIGIFASRSKKESKGKLLGPLWTDSLLVLVLLVGFALFLEPLGFLVSTFLFLLILVGRKKTYSWATVLVLSIGPTIVMYIVFEVWLQVNLPKGVLGYFGF